MKVTSYIWLVIAATVAKEGSTSKGFTKNNPLNLKGGKVFYSSRGLVIDLYSTDKEIRNIQVPQSEECKNSFFTFMNLVAPPIYFNLYNNNESEGVFVLRNNIAQKIIDGTDSVITRYVGDAQDSGVHDPLVYISTSDGIYTYNPQTEATTKFGTITGNFKAIDKTSDRDEVYVLAIDNKIYKITDRGTLKTQVEGIDFAKDFFVARTGDVYFVGEDNKPQVLYKGAETAVKISGLNFDVKKTLLSRPIVNLYGFADFKRTIQITVDGVSYVNKNNTVQAFGCDNVVAGLTAFSAACTYAHYYGENGHIYMHRLLAYNPKPKPTL